MMQECTWNRVGMVGEELADYEAELGYICMDETLRNEVVDTRVLSEVGAGQSNHYIVRSDIVISW